MTKYLLIILSILIFLNHPLFSQPHFGIKYGANLSYIIGGNYSGSGNLNEEHFKYCNNLEIFYSNNFNEDQSFQVDILYNEKGSKWGQILFD